MSCSPPQRHAAKRDRPHKLRADDWDVRYQAHENKKQGPLSDSHAVCHRLVTVTDTLIMKAITMIVKRNRCARVKHTSSRNVMPLPAGPSSRSPGGR
jgi:hypothetical protein